MEQKNMFGVKRNYSFCARRVLANHLHSFGDTTQYRNPMKRAFEETIETAWKYTETLTYTAPPGSYYIGDLCSSLDEDLTTHLLTKFKLKDGLYQRDGSSTDFIFVHKTKWGDGCYDGSDGREFPVDSGTIGIAPVSLCTDGFHVQRYTFDAPVTCTADEDGKFSFASGDTVLTINTGEDETEDAPLVNKRVRVEHLCLLSTEQLKDVCTRLRLGSEGTMKQITDRLDKACVMYSDLSRNELQHILCYLASSYVA